MDDTAKQLLEDLVTQKQEEIDPSSQMSDEEFFEFFSTQLVLRHYELNPTEIRSGMVSQSANKTLPGNDGGIDV